MTAPTAGFRFAVRDLDSLGRSRFMSDRWTAVAATAMPGFPATKLQTDLLSDYWLAYNHRSSNTWLGLTSDDTTGSSSTRSIGVISALGVNRRSPSALIPGALYTPNTIRFRVDSYPLTDRIRPSCTLSSKVNLSGVDTNFTGHPIDPPDDPAPTGYAETKLTPTSSGSATSLIASFTNHYSTERALSGTQTFRLHLRDVNNPTKIPTLTAVIYQSASPSVTLTSPTYEHVAVASSSGGFIFTFTFLSSSLTSQTATMDVHLSTTTACDFIGIEMVLNLTGHLYDSGVESFAGLDLTMVAERLDLTLNTGVTYIHLEFSDFCSYTSASYTLVAGGSASAATYSSIVAPNDSDGRLRVGRLLAADAITFPINGVGGYNLQLVQDSSTSSSTSNRTRSGALRSPRSVGEWNEVDLSIIRISRVLSQRIERLVRTLGILHNPTLLVPDPNLVEGNWDEQVMPRWVVIGSKTEAHQGRMSGVDSDSGSDGLNHSVDRWDVNMHLVEHGGSRSGG